MRYVINLILVMSERVPLFGLFIAQDGRVTAREIALL